ncbi:hypothetical protein Tco_1341123, partial [Tanacetum coccineum]
ELKDHAIIDSGCSELTFFLGLQVKQSTVGIFISQDRYVKDILNKFNFRTLKPATTPIEAHKALGKDEEGEDVDVHLYRSMIGSTFKGRTDCKVWTLKEDLMLFLMGGVHILELKNGIMIHMLVEQRYPLTRELMQRMLEHKLEVQKETENALNVIRFVMKQKEDLEREEE